MMGSLNEESWSRTSFICLSPQRINNEQLRLSQKCSREDRIMRRMSLGSCFNTAAGIAEQYRVRVCVAHVQAFGLKACTALTKPSISKKNHKARLTFVEEYVEQTDPNFTSLMKRRLIYLGLMRNIVFVIKLGKEWTPNCVLYCHSHWWPLIFSIVCYFVKHRWCCMVYPQQ